MPLLKKARQVETCKSKVNYVDVDATKKDRLISYYELAYPYSDASKDLLLPDNDKLQRNSYDDYFATPYFTTTVAKFISGYVELRGYRPRLIGYEKGWFQYVVFDNNRQILGASAPLEVLTPDGITFELSDHQTDPPELVDAALAVGQSRVVGYVTVKLVLPPNFLTEPE